MVEIKIYGYDVTAQIEIGNSFEYIIEERDSPDSEPDRSVMDIVKCALNNDFEIIKIEPSELRASDEKSHDRYLLFHDMVMLEYDYKHAIESDFRLYPQQAGAASSFVGWDTSHIAATFCLDRQQYETRSHRVLEDAHDIVKDFLERLHDHLL